MKNNRLLTQPWQRWFTRLCLVLMVGYWAWQIVLAYESAIPEDPTGNLLLFLSSWLLVILLAGVVAWANYRWVFLLWQMQRIGTSLFVVSQFVLLMLGFELLQWLTNYESTLRVDNIMVTLFFALFMVLFTIVAEIFSVKRKQQQLLQQKDHAELKLLQSQLNPHFLFNALNTLYSSALSGQGEKTAQQIQQLSDLMRYATDMAGRDWVPLEAELDFLRQYIRLQSARMEQHAASLEWEVTWDGIAADISPMLLQPLVENAFKFARFETPQMDKLHIVIAAEEGVVTLQTHNSCTPEHTRVNKGMGKGIAWVRQRLENDYAGKHVLMIDEQQDIFTVNLTVQLNTTKAW